MGSDRFSQSVIIQSVLLAITGTAAVTVLIGDYLIVTKMSFLIVWALQIYLLIWYVNRTNRDLEQFLQSLKHLDKINITGSGQSYRRLNLTYNEIIEILRQERTIKEAEYQYFQETIEHINTGLISFTDKGRINFLNTAAKNTLKCGNCKQITQLSKVNTELPGLLLSLEPGRPQLLTLQIDGNIVKLSFSLALLKIHRENIRLVSFVDIKGELEEGELEAWQKLIRVLTHEIVNSVTPINTLTTAMISQLNKAGNEESDFSNNLDSGLQAIRKRNKGLLTFVDNFRRINRIPKPNLKKIGIREFLESVQSLMKEELRNTQLEFRIEDDFTLEADEELITQVLINLLKNAAEANAGLIEVIARSSKTDRPQILVKDNGQGIEKENIDQIFIPFYSSKKEGSGIGLSLSRQIMRLHRGEISYYPPEDTGSIFVLTF